MTCSICSPQGCFSRCSFLALWVAPFWPVACTLCLWPGFLCRSCFELSNWGPTLRHNELRDFIAEILSEVCADICTEPPLQPLSGETLTYATANVEDGTRLDISAAGFWRGQHQKAYFDVKVFNLNASEQRIREIEMASFTPLVFSTSDDMSGCTNVFFKRLAYLFSLKKKLDYGNVMAWLRCRLSFSLLRSAIACLRGARSHRGCPANCAALDLALAEGQVCDHAN